MKIIKLFSLLLFLFASQKAFSADAKNLSKSDSLFSAGQYEEALKGYEEIYFQVGKHSNSMLLRMALACELGGDYARSLAFLNLYYSNTSKLEALNRMEVIASKNKLSGYDISDSDHLMRWLDKRRTSIEMTLLAVIFLSLSAYFFGRKKINISASKFGTVICLLALMLAGIINLGRPKSSGVVISDNAWLMSAPSSASEAEEKVLKGNRLFILDHEDVWLKVSLDGRTGYLKQSNILF